MSYTKYNYSITAIFIIASTSLLNEHGLNLKAFHVNKNSTTKQTFF